MQLNLKVFHRGLILVGVPLLCGIFILSSLFVVIIETDKEVAQGQKYKRIEEEVSILVVTLYHLAYQMKLVVQEGAFGQISEMTDNLRTIVQVKKQLFADISDFKQSKYDEARYAINAGLGTVARILKSFLGRGSSLQAMYGTDFRKERQDVAVQLEQAYNALQTLLSESQEHLVETSLRKQETLRQLQAFILSGGLLVSIVLAIVLARFFMSGIVKRLAVITDNTERLSSGQTLNPGLTGGDEIAEVDEAFHEMAAALSQTAERERALFDNASDVICVLSQAGRFTRVNPATWRVWGRRPEDLNGADLIELVYPEDREAVMTAVGRAQSESPSLSFECRLLASDDRLMETLWSVYWAESEESLFCVVHDISERKKLERMKQEFLAMVSHDLRSPLTSITGVFELLSRGKYGVLSAAAIDKVGMARRNVARLLSMVNDLLDMEKLEAGQLDLQIQPVEISDLLGSCLQEVEGLAEQRKVKLDLNSCQMEVSIDGDRITQVIVNLLSNAIKFSPADGLVTLSAWAVGDKLEIRVKDQGRGVPALYRQSIFERFKQVEAADGKRKAGTGLGLPICKQLVELHGGSIGVDSQDDQGSTFWVVLPLVPQVVGLQELVRTARLSAVPRPEGARAEAKLSTKTVQPVSAVETGKPRFSLRSDLSMFHKGVLLVGVPLTFELILVGLLTVTLVQVNKVKQYEHYLHQISYSATKIVADFTMAGRIVSSQHSQSGVSAFAEVGTDLLQEYEKLRALVARDPALTETFAEFDEKARPGLDFIVRDLKIYKQVSDPKLALGIAFKDREMMEPVVDNLSVYLVRFLTRLDELNSTSPEQQARLRREQGILLIAGVCINIALSILLVAFFSRGIKDRLAVLKENEVLLAREQALRPPMAGRDEIAHLDRVFHKMAISLNEALHKERAVFDNSQDVICAIDPDGVFRQINSASSRLWGYQPEQLLNSSVFGLVVAADHDSFFEQLQAAQSGGTIVYFENHVDCKDGQSKDILWSANWSEQRKLFFCVAHDITERKELERLKQDFLSMVSHDLRTPLTAVNGVAKLMLAGALGPLPELAGQKLQIVVNNVERLLNLINDLLDIEKLEAGEMQLSFEPTAVVSILERSAQALEGLARERQVEVMVKAGDGQINADGDRLIQALVNLLSNAIKFSPEGGTVALSAEFKDGFCEMRVADQGRGIPESYRSTIFERFKQVEAADGKRSKGTGLGLPIAKKIAEQHGGAIGVESEIGKGSTFWLRIPGATP
jgi:PAS domain S-box-containing protein